MKRLDPLVLSDADTFLSDTLDVQDCPDDAEVYVFIDAAEGGGIRLNKTAARALFNWLGVWLHRS